eukprot:CAMPEP_0173203346 /NCGR_PEP_ID=MMETSP1141-20130122/19470_1 /TAXON_ID=483371 /ORGANISM="non described non described, Strain CCMP2298" /LENGTH=67 /DNA_ID=CAMNT_0014128797 /DNA_START=40 /DNA_END=240 /DNA_ORIENTATION=+
MFAFLVLSVLLVACSAFQMGRNSVFHGRSSLSMADIVDTAVGAGSFNTLAAALTAAGLIDTLKSAGP